MFVAAVEEIVRVAYLGVHAPLGAQLPNRLSSEGQWRGKCLGHS